MSNSPTTEHDFPGQNAEVGEEISIPIVRGAMWAVHIPDQIIPSAFAPGMVEVVLLNQEARSVRQKARVKERVDQGAMIEVVDTQIVTQLTDICHVRLSGDHAFKFAITLLGHLVQHHGLQPDLIDGELTAVLAAATSTQQ